MDIGTIFLVIVALIFLFPIVSLWHEWGHVVVARFWNMHVSKVQLGMGQPLSTWKKKGTEFQFNWNLFMGGHTFIENEEHYSRLQRMTVVLGGVFMSGILYYVMWLILPYVGTTGIYQLSYLVYVVMVINLYMLVVHLFPYWKGMGRGHSGYPSDGLMLIQILFRRQKN